MSERGEIENRARRQQIADMRGLLWGKITPTDIDGFLDFGGRLFVFFEGKYNLAKVGHGQRLALENACIAMNCAPGRVAIAIICDHFVENTEVDIVSADMIVREWFHPKVGEWRTTNGKEFLLKEFIDRLRKHYLHKD
jgi:hypothetical protein